VADAEGAYHQKALSLTIDVSSLPASAQKILDPAGPAPLKAMAAKGLVPGLKPAEVLTVVVVLSRGEGPTAEQAGKTLAALPAPLLNGALTGDLHPAVIDALAPIYGKDPILAEKLLNHPAIAASTVATIASVAADLVCELIATNEERLLAHPEIIEKLYMNRNTRMSTSDRILELAVRNKIDLQIPAFAQAKAAIEGELISEPTAEPTFDDVQIQEALAKSAELELGEDEDTHELDPLTGEEQVVEKARSLHGIWQELRPPQKIRMLLLENKKELRMLGVRDANPLVAETAAGAPGVNESEVERWARLRNVAEVVLREISRNKEWTRHYNVKKALVMNPRTPFGNASRFVLHLYENDLKAIAKSREVPGAIQQAAKQQLQRKGKGG
jgi:hypothetical protein